MGDGGILFRGMRRDWAISATVHALVLGAGLISFAAKPLEKSSVNSVAVDIISASELSQLTAGSKTAPKVGKPMADKLGDTKPPPDDPSAKPVNKPEIKMAAVTPPPAASKPEPNPEPPPPEAKAPPAAGAEGRTRSDCRGLGTRTGQAEGRGQAPGRGEETRRGQKARGGQETRRGQKARGGPQA